MLELLQLSFLYVVLQCKQKVWNIKIIYMVWRKYIEQLFDDDRPEATEWECVTGPSIMEEEVRTAIKDLKMGKTPGPDNTEAEFLKLINDENIKWLTSMLNRVYDSGDIPTQWLRAEFITLPKKPSAKVCGEYRTICLMSHLLKLFLKILQRRIYGLCEENIFVTQFWFRDAVGTREALFCVQVLFQRCRDMNVDVYACFIDYRKAFDRVQHHKMVEILKDLGLDDKDLRIIVNLYWNQSACVNVEGERTDEVKIRRGVRQGCVLSPLLFNVYSERIFREALEGAEMGIMVNGERLNNIRYADDTVMFADNPRGLQALMDRVIVCSRRYGLDINIGKTKLMVISKAERVECRIVIDQVPIERVNRYTYLGTVFNES